MSDKWFSVLRFDFVSDPGRISKNFWFRRKAYKRCLKANRKALDKVDYVCRGMVWKYWDNFCSEKRGCLDTLKNEKGEHSLKEG